MPKFIVTQFSVLAQDWEIEAKDEEQALKLLISGDSPVKISQVYTVPEKLHREIKARL